MVRLRAEIDATRFSSLAALLLGTWAWRRSGNQALGGRGVGSVASDARSVSLMAITWSSSINRIDTARASDPGAQTRTEVQTKANGQSWAQSGIAGSGQQGISSDIAEAISISIAESAKDGAIGAKNKPIRARIASGRAKKDFRFMW
jgi:hypothetical protein